MKTPEKFQDLLLDGTKAFAILATISKYGNPQSSPVWFNTDGDTILINSAIGRVKDRNMRLNPSVSLVILDPKNPYRYLQIRGRVVEVTEENAGEHISVLSLKYTGKRYSIPAGQVRVMYRIEPTSYSGNG